jgi:hypothetical protein
LARISSATHGAQVLADSFELDDFPLPDDVVEGVVEGLARDSLSDPPAGVDVAGWASPEPFSLPPL